VLCAVAGRDTSIAVGGSRAAPSIYVSFLDYNGDGSAKRASLAILKPAKPEAADDKASALRVSAAAATPATLAHPAPPDGGKNDICKNQQYSE
jgi:hypothetical protein